MHKPRRVTGAIRSSRPCCRAHRREVGIEGADSRTCDVTRRAAHSEIEGGECARELGVDRRELGGGITLRRRAQRQSVNSIDPKKAAFRHALRVVAFTGGRPYCSRRKEARAGPVFAGIPCFFRETGNDV